MDILQPYSREGITWLPCCCVLLITHNTCGVVCRACTHLPGALRAAPLAALSDVAARAQPAIHQGCDSIRQSYPSPARGCNSLATVWTRQLHRQLRGEFESAWAVVRPTPKRRTRGIVPVCPSPLQLVIVKQDCSRLANENSALHSQLIQASERNEALQVGGSIQGRVCAWGAAKAAGGSLALGCGGGCVQVPERTAALECLCGP